MQPKYNQNVDFLWLCGYHLNPSLSFCFSFSLSPARPLTRNFINCLHVFSAYQKAKVKVSFRCFLRGSVCVSASWMTNIDMVQWKPGKTQNKCWEKLSKQYHWLVRPNWITRLYQRSANRISSDIGILLTNYWIWIWLPTRLWLLRSMQIVNTRRDIVVSPILISPIGSTGRILNISITVLSITKLVLVIRGKVISDRLHRKGEGGCPVHCRMPSESNKQTNCMHFEQPAQQERNFQNKKQKQLFYRKFPGEGVAAPSRGSDWDSETESESKLQPA